MKSRYVQSPRHTVEVDWLPYLDEIAELLSCKPDIGKDDLEKGMHKL